MIVAPITHTYKNLPCIIKFEDKFDSDGNLCLDGYVNVSEIREVSKARLEDYICDLSKNEIKRVDEALAIQLGIKHYYDKSNNILNDKLIYISKLNDILNEIKEKTGAKNNKEILEKIQIILDNSKD